MPAPQIEIKDLSKYYHGKIGEICAYSNINLNITSGEFVCFVGPSGCGKTTLLRTIAGIEKPSSGSYQFCIDVNKNEPDVGMVFQEQALFPWMTIEDNVKFLLENNPKIAQQNINKITLDYLQKVGLSKFAKLYPEQTSGGMKQRISLARSFANEPDILLMDEPFVYLDYQTRIKLQNLLLNILAESQKTVLFVTHDVEEALLLADRVILMSAHPGKIMREFTIHYGRPRVFNQLRKDAEFISLLDEINQLLGGQMLDEQICDIKS